MRIAAVAFIRGLVFRRLEVRRSPLFVHCQRRYRTPAPGSSATPHPPDPKALEDAAKR